MFTIRWVHSTLQSIMKLTLGFSGYHTVSLFKNGLFFFVGRESAVSVRKWLYFPLNGNDCRIRVYRWREFWYLSFTKSFQRFFSILIRFFRREFLIPFRALLYKWHYCRPWESCGTYVGLRLSCVFNMADEVIMTSFDRDKNSKALSYSSDITFSLWVFARVVFLSEENEVQKHPRESSNVIVWRCAFQWICQRWWFVHAGEDSSCG